MNIECFGCSGGMAEGFKRAGVLFDLSFDYDEDACASYEKNIGHKPIRLDVRDLVHLMKVGFRPALLRDFDLVDLFVADPPCTPWSRSGKRKGLADERDMLRETVDLIRMLRPRAYLIGNVPGLQDAKSWSVVQDVLEPLGKEGYCIVDYAQFDAADYGVPQRRIRPFWFGHRIDVLPTCITWPEPTHGDLSKQLQLPGVSSLRPWVTCRDALSHLSPKELGRKVRLHWKDGTRAKTITRNTHSDGTLLIGSDNSRFRRPSKADRPARTVMAGDGTNGNKLLEWPGDRPATTILSDPRLGMPGHHSAMHSRGARAIVLSEMAAKLLQSFPPDWHFAGKTKKKRWAQIGMAMPPLLAFAVATSVRRVVFG